MRGRFWNVGHPFNRRSRSLLHTCRLCALHRHCECSLLKPISLHHEIVDTRSDDCGEHGFKTTRTTVITVRQLLRHGIVVQVQECIQFTCARIKRYQGPVITDNDGIDLLVARVAYTVSPRHRGPADGLSTCYSAIVRWHSTRCSHCEAALFVSISFDKNCIKTETIAGNRTYVCVSCTTRPALVFSTLSYFPYNHCGLFGNLKGE